MKLCVFQGTFNPIHKIHIKVAKFVKQNYDFDKILFIPAFIPPHKNVDKNLAIHRYNMVKLAINGIDGFEISDIEYKRNENSYTYHTILELKKIYKINDKIHFIIGTDAFEKIETWYETDKLKDLVHFIVFPRTNNFIKDDFEHLKIKGYDFEFASMDYIDVSSTDLRDKVKNNASIENIELKKVKEYIKNNGLYLD